MARRVVLAWLLALAAGWAVPASGAAAARPVVGIGEQKPALFADAHWKSLRAPHVRVVVSWDVLLEPAELAELDAYMHAARAARARLLVTFAHSRTEGHEDEIPSTRTWRRLFREFRARYPQVREFQAWNEGNHGTQPTWRAPRRAAQLYDAMVSACRRCTISAPSVLDGPNMLSWIRRFRGAARHPVRIWSLHNYLDANRDRSIGTRKLLRNVRGTIWFTETGGIVERFVEGRRLHGYSERTAAAAVRRVFRLAALSPRIRRVYLYNWFAPPARSRWDSGLMGRDLQPRPAFGVLRRELARIRR
jgi:hypothetical protein